MYQRFKGDIHRSVASKTGGINFQGKGMGINKLWKEVLRWDI